MLPTDAVSTASSHSQEDQHASQPDCSASGRGEGHASPGLQSVQSPGDLLRGENNLFLEAFCRDSLACALVTTASLEEEVMAAQVHRSAASIGRSFRRSWAAEDPWHDGKARLIP